MAMAARARALRRGAARRDGALRVRAAATALPAEYASLAPVGERVLVKLADTEETTAGGIVLVTKKKPTAGTVTGCCDKVKGVTKGTVVAYSPNAGSDFEIGGEPHLLLKGADVLGELPAAGADVSELKPTPDRVLVKFTSGATTSAAGLVFAESGSTEVPQIGAVVASNAELFEAGDVIVIEKYAGVEFEGDEGKYSVVRVMDIIAKLS